MRTSDTIVAVSSALAPGARVIVRLSGPGAWPIAAGACVGVPAFAANYACRVRLAVSDMAVPAWAYAFQSPYSYSGEDIVELHMPGNPLLVRMLLSQLVTAGARPAEAGEFTARAYFNGRMDLSAAEGVAATIAAHGEAELRAARQLLAGELSRRLRPILDALAETLALVETGIDFSEEDITILAPDQLAARISAIEAGLEELVADSARFDKLSHEPQFVLVGRPNAGKSTLLNALAGQPRAIVSPVAGTTRDVLSAEVQLDRGLVRVVDAAGLSDAPASPIEQSIHRRALSAVEQSDFVVLVRDSSVDLSPPTLPRPADLVVLTKIDLLEPLRFPSAWTQEEGWGEGVGRRSSNVAGPSPAEPPLSVSALTGMNLDLLRTRLSDLAFGAAPAGSALALAQRHLDCIVAARGSLARARSAADGAAASPELIALDLRESLDTLGQILGQITPDDILGRIFSRLCIGK